MMRTDKDALMCDLAETYGIYDMSSVPVRTLATLAAGLRADSRIKMKIAGVSASADTCLLAAILDRIGAFIYMLSDKSQEPPASVLNLLTGRTDAESACACFETGADFDNEWKRRTADTEE